MDSKLAATRAGITYRQIDHWTRQGYLLPTGGGGSGNSRSYSEIEVAVARTMGCMVAAGFTNQAAAKLARTSVVLGEGRLYLGHGVTVLVEPHTHKE